MTLKRILAFLRRRDVIKTIIVTLISLIIWWLPTSIFGIEGLTILQHRVIAIFVFAALMWITETVPAWVTSVLIIVTMLLTVSNSGITPLVNYIPKEELVSYKSIMYTFADQTVMLFLGGFVLAIVASKYGVDVTLARALLKPFGTRPSTVLLGFLMVTAFFSMFVSNTATAAMMLAFLTPVLKMLPPDGGGRISLALAIPIGANIGGVATPIGTPPNGIALGYLNDVEGLNLGITFGQWFMVMFPLMITIVVLAWFILKTVYPFKAKEIKLEIKGGARNNWRTNLIYVTFAVTIALWMLEKVVGMNAYVVALIPVGVFCATGIFMLSENRRIKSQRSFSGI